DRFQPSAWQKFIQQLNTWNMEDVDQLRWPLCAIAIEARYLSLNCASLLAERLNWHSFNDSEGMDEEEREAFLEAIQAGDCFDFLSLLEDGSVKSRVINHSPVTLSAQQIEESRTRLSALKIYPRDMLINRTFKAKLEELWARALGDEREEIGRVITDFDAALQSNDMARVDEVRRRASVYLAIETS
ncbi:hypothetical protein ACUOCP_15615, partial [Escherichia sp. R-CC3]